MAYEALSAHHWVRVPIEVTTADGFADVLEERAAKALEAAPQRARVLREVATLARKMPLRSLERELELRATSELDRDLRGTLRGCADAARRLAELNERRANSRS